MQKSITFAELQKSEIKQKIDEMSNQYKESSFANGAQAAEMRGMERDEAQAEAELGLLKKEIEDLHKRMELQRQESNANRQELSRLEPILKEKEEDLEGVKSSGFEESEISQYLTEKIKGRSKLLTTLKELKTRTSVY